MYVDGPPPQPQMTPFIQIFYAFFICPINVLSARLIDFGSITLW